MSTADLDEFGLNDDNLGDDFDVDNLGDADGAMFDMDEDELFNDLDMAGNDDLEKPPTNKNDLNHNKSPTNVQNNDIQITNEFKHEEEAPQKRDIHSNEGGSSKQELNENNTVSNQFKKKRTDNDARNTAIARKGNELNLKPKSKPSQPTITLSGNKRSRTDFDLNPPMHPPKRSKTNNNTKTNGDRPRSDFDLNTKNANPKRRNSSLSSTSSQQMTQPKSNLRVSFQENTETRPKKLFSQSKTTVKKLSFRLTKMHSKDEEMENNHANIQKETDLKEEPVDIEALIDSAQKKMDSIYNLWQKGKHDYVERKKEIEAEFTKQMQECLNRVAEEKQNEIQDIHQKTEKNRLKRTKLEDSQRLMAHLTRPLI